MRASAEEACRARAILEGTLKEGTMEELEWLVEITVKACPNLFVVARGLRAALQDDWERLEVADLLLEGVEE
ncbi:MAG: hypothetical protein V3S55_07740 [Nitrospiraceae bacterium]